MKEAIGELNGTIIVIMAVGALSAFFFTFMWPTLADGMDKRARRSDAVCECGFTSNYTSYCYNPRDDKKTVFECPYRG